MDDAGDEAVSPMAAEEVAVTREPGDVPPRGPSASEERLNVSLLILQRVDHLEMRVERFEDKTDARFAAVDAKFIALEDKMDTRFAAMDTEIDEVRRELSAKFDGLSAKIVWIFGLILVAVLAKVFIPQL